MTLTPRAKRVIDLAYDEARTLNNNFIGTEHLLLGLIREEDGLAGRVLKKQNIKLEPARKETLVAQEKQGVRSPDQPNFVDRLRERFGHAKADAYWKPAESLRVRYDLQLLHPVDQVLLALLSDDESELGRGLREEFPTLNFLLPYILSIMTNAFVAERPNLTSVLMEAHLLAARESREVLKAEDLYLACIKHTAPQVRGALRDVGINPFPETGGTETDE